MECTICMEVMQYSAHSLTCGHLFHEHCVEGMIQGAMGSSSWYRDQPLTCPICRTSSPSDVSPGGLRRIFIGHQAASLPPVVLPEEHTAEDSVNQLLLDQLEKLQAVNVVVEAEIATLDQQLVDKEAENVELRFRLDRANEELFASESEARSEEYSVTNRERSDFERALAQKDEIIKRLERRLREADDWSVEVVLRCARNLHIHEHYQEERAIGYEDDDAD